MIGATVGTMSGLFFIATTASSPALGVLHARARPALMRTVKVPFTACRRHCSDLAAYGPLEVISCDLID